MGRYTFILRSPEIRRTAHEWVDKAPDGYVLTLREQTRSVEQSNRMWAMLTDVSIAKPKGRTEAPEIWKAVFMQALGWETEFVNSLDGKPFPLGFRSSELTVSQMRDLMDFIQAYGDQNGVTFREPVVKDQSS